MLMYEIITKKRDGLALSKEEIAYWIAGCIDGSIPDYQSAALLMAARINGLNNEETISLVEQMTNSGDKIDLSNISGIKADKHSTGGVGDKTSLIVMPIVAAAGLKVAKMSGRGLGHTGGTLDKLESIPGMNVNLTIDEFTKQVETHGISIISQTKSLVPADKKLYALRDLTATVDSIHLIAASIMSKKIATGADILVLDVKYGSGALIKNIEESRELAQTMINIAKGVGIKATAVLSSMEQPLGFAVGNALEVKECIATLNGNGPDDLLQLSIELAAQLLLLGNIAQTHEQATKLAQKQITNKTALAKLVEMISAQDGTNDFTALPKSANVINYLAKDTGYINTIDSQKIGFAALLSGAGRIKKEDMIDPAAGIILNAKIGDFVNEGDIIAKIHFENNENEKDITNQLDQAFQIISTKTPMFQLIKEIII